MTASFIILSGPVSRQILVRRAEGHRIWSRRFRGFIDKKAEDKMREKGLGVDLVDNKAKDSLVL